MMDGRSPVGEPLVPRITRSRERVFHAPVWRQLHEGSWPFVLSILLPPVIVIGSLIYALITEDSRSLWGVIGALGVAAGEFLSFAVKRPKPEAGTVTPCSWIALGDRYVRLGMGLLRPGILFEQIVGVDRGVLKRGRWEAAPYGTRARVRFVLREGWTVGAVAYPLSMDPLGELTMHLRLAASRNQDRLRFAEDAPDEEVSAVYGRLETHYRRRVALQPSAAPAPAVNPDPRTANPEPSLPYQEAC